MGSKHTLTPRTYFQGRPGNPTPMIYAPGGFNYGYTSIRRVLDCLSKVIKCAVM